MKKGTGNPDCTNSTNNEENNYNDDFAIDNWLKRQITSIENSTK